MRILITGATGLIGSSLTAGCWRFHHITVLTRDERRARAELGDQPSYWQTLDDRQSLDDFDAVINLAGEPIADKRWSAQQKQRLCHSRWDLTERLAQLIKAGSTPPGVLISGSAVGYYGDGDRRWSPKRSRRTTIHPPAVPTLGSAGAAGAERRNPRLPAAHRRGAGATGWRAG